MPNHPAPRAGEAHRIAVLTSDRSALEGIQEFIVPVFHTSLLESPEAMGPLLSDTGLGAVVFDLEAGGQTTAAGIDAMHHLREMDDSLVLIAMTRSGSKAVRRKALALGADHLFVAPVDFAEVGKLLHDLLEKRTLEVEKRRVMQQITGKSSFCDLIGGSDSMRRIYESIVRVADSNTTVLIQGESGTGKELVARALVAMSSRRHQPFVSVNCAALPENLIEAELFGHERGAFTGAHAARAGHIEMAEGGTLFLDEIGTLGMALQSKLLRVLEDRAVQRIGGTAARKIDFRLITASNSDLEEMQRTGRFREDLYYRINVVPLSLPPLRKRAGDVSLLVGHFLKTYCQANGMPVKRAGPEVMAILEEYEWPGNVRELENLMQRLVMMAEGQVIAVKHLPQNILFQSTAQQESILIPAEGINFDEEMLKMESAYVRAALNRTGGKKAAAARLLQIPAQKMKYLCRKHAIPGH